MISAQPLLEMEHIVRHYETGGEVVRALDDVSLAIWPGEFVAIMGQSGSGKTTLMNIIGCLDTPTNGSYRIFGKEVGNLGSDELAGLRRDVFGFVFQRYNLLATASAEENVEIPAVYAALPKSERLERARNLLSKLGLGERGSHRPNELSGGQQQRVAIARALVNEPAIILADEPTGALDSKSGAEVMTLLKQLHQEGKTIILITHDEHVASNAKRVIRIADGKIISDTGLESETLRATKPEIQENYGSKLPEIQEAVKTALRALRVNFSRTILTLLGIVIGVASVVVMLAIGAGSKEKVLKQISAMGTNLLSVRPGASGIRSSGDIVTLTWEDAEAIREIPNVEFVLPERNGRFTARLGNIDYATSVQGTGPVLPQIRDWPVVQGSFFSERDFKSYAPVAVIGQTVLKNLFPYGENPIGKNILIKNVPFEIIGVMGEKGASFMGTDQDDAVFVPVTTGTIRLFGKKFLNSITIKVEDLNHIEETKNNITKMLVERHRTEDFSIRNMAAILETATATQNTLTILLGTVAAISLLVGGIGVMNIMLVSVTERTREIGIRMATGARMKDIMLQFNTEAAVVCTIGGVLGVILGFLVGWGLMLFDVDVIFSVMPVVLAFSCAVGTGLLFGYLPARKAARLDPVVALSSE
jgi:macrolide transport system ATP-binding/permease protein